MDSSTIARVNATQERALFDLGWDYFAAKQGLPDDEKLYPSLGKGYAAAKERIKPIRGDRFELKWLQLRYGAIRRERALDEETIHPLMIQMMDTELCPITRIVLTHSTANDSDWSIDRVHNNIGYTVGNLVVCSTKANIAKGAMSYSEICEAANSNLPYRGLTPIEWKRWLSISSHAIPVENDGNHVRFRFECVPYVTQCPLFMPMNVSASLQLAIAWKAYNRDVEIWNLLTKGLSSECRKALSKLLHHTEKYRDAYAETILDIWFIPSLFNRFKKLYDSLSYADFEMLEKNCEKNFMTAQARQIINPKAWDPANKGYTRMRPNAHI